VGLGATYWLRPSLPSLTPWQDRGGDPRLALGSVAGVGGLPVGVVDAPQAPLDGTHGEDVEHLGAGAGAPFSVR